MKFFGYIEDNDNILELTEVTCQAAPKDLRALAQFFNRCANEIESDPDWEHEHFSDDQANSDIEVDIIVISNDV